MNCSGAEHFKLLGLREWRIQLWVAAESSSEQREGREPLQQNEQEQSRLGGFLWTAMNSSAPVEQIERIALNELALELSAEQLRSALQRESERARNRERKRNGSVSEDSALALCVLHQPAERAFPLRLVRLRLAEHSTSTAAAAAISHLLDRLRDSLSATVALLVLSALSVALSLLLLRLCAAKTAASTHS